MGITINGPKRPKNAFVQLKIEHTKAYEFEGLLEDVMDELRDFKPSEGYFQPNNRKLYDTLWERIFHSLTGEHLHECVTISLFSEEEYLPRICQCFGDIDTFSEAVGYHPMQIAGVNLDGTWIIHRNKMNLALLVDMFHEIGHRIFPKSDNRYWHELGANYFMFLAIQKLRVEIEPFGGSFAPVDFGEQITDDHKRSLEKARTLVLNREAYIHKSGKDTAVGFNY